MRQKSMSKKAPAEKVVRDIRRKTRKGIVRLTGRELADQKRSWFSHGELTPLSERGNAVLFENVAAVEVAVQVEVVMDRGMGRGKFLESFYIPEARHRPLSSSERLV